MSVIIIGLWSVESKDPFKVSNQYSQSLGMNKRRKDKLFRLTLF